MSTPIQFTDQPRAMNAANALLVSAAMTFYDDSDDIAIAYADPAHSIALPWPLKSDSAGRFTPLWLPDAITRVRLEDSHGVKVWDLDPFDKFPGSISGMPLDDAGRPMPLAQFTFYWAGTTELAVIYADDSLTSTLDNPLTADASGQFPDIWLDDELLYRVTLKQASGVLIYDVDDYQVLQQVPFVPPSAVTLSGDMGALTASLSWTASVAGTFDIDYYELYKATSGGSYSLLSTIDAGDPLEYVDSGLSYDTLYSYYVVAFDTDGNQSSDSNVVNVTESESVPTDPYYDSMVLLCHFNGTDGDGDGGIFTDFSKYARTVTGSESAQIDTDNAKFGAGSLSVGAYGQIFTAYASELALGSNDFTIEYWYRGTSNEPIVILTTTKAGDSRYPVLISRSTGNGLSATGSDSLGNTRYSCNIPSGTNINDGNWHHIALVRFGSNFVLYLDGNGYVSDLPGFSGSLGSASQPWRFMDPSSSWTVEVGHMDDLRVTIGVARYTSNFTPPTAEFPNAGPS